MYLRSGKMLGEDKVAAVETVVGETIQKDQEEFGSTTSLEMPIEVPPVSGMGDLSAIMAMMRNSVSR